MQLQNTQDDIEELEITIEDARKKVALRDAALRLANNRDFKKLIMDEYFTQYAANLVSQTADPATSDRRENAIERILGISHLRVFLQETITLGNQSEAAIIENQEALDEIREEEAMQ